MTDSFIDATDLAEQVRTGQRHPSEVVDNAIARAEKVQEKLNIMVADTFDDARARAVDLPADGPLAGVPIFMKDLGGPVAGEPAPNGNRVLRDLGRRHTITGAVGRRLRAAGSVSLGRSHSPEFGSGNCPASAETAAFGLTLNPWNTAHTPMGSSGGSAAAVAMGVVPAAHATDGGGSIRMPASACGIVGFKAGRGRVSNAPFPTPWGGGVVEGAVTRTVRDAALMLDVLVGAEPGDDFTAAPIDGTYMSHVGADPGRLRVGVLASVPYAETHAECLAAVEKTTALLDSLGHAVDTDAHPEVLDRLDYLFDYIRVIRVSGATVLEELSSELNRPWSADDVEDGTWQNYQRGLKVTAPDYASSLSRLHFFTQDVVGWWDDFDVLVTPTLATPPPPNRFLIDGDDRQRRDRLGVAMPFTAQFNVTGQPAVSLPLHWTADGLPVGVQLVGAPGREDVLLRLSAQIEAAQPWAHRYDMLAS
ncbi:MAG: amidase [Acidimicrobiales bacterium]|jgi:amidase